MHGAQGPGGPREGIGPESTGPRSAGRREYARRRIIAVLVLLLLLALLAPRACQALMGSNDDAGPPGGGDQQAGVAGTGAGSEDGSGGADEPNSGTDDAGTGNADTNETDAEDPDAQEPETKGDAPDRGAPFVDERPGGGDGDEEAAPDLLALVTPLAVEDSAAGDGGDTTSPPETAAAPPAGQQPTTESQNVFIARRAAPEQPPSDEEPASNRRSGPAGGPVADAPAAVEPVTGPPGERIRDGRDRAPRVAAVPANFGGAGARQTLVEPVTAEPEAPAPVRVSTLTPPVVPTTPVPAVVQNGPAFGGGLAFRGAAVAPAAGTAGPGAAMRGPAF